jgi:hypothetical protein
MTPLWLDPGTSHQKTKASPPKRAEKDWAIEGGGECNME